MKTETCRICKGTGVYAQNGRPCYTCLGKGTYETDVPGRRINLSHAHIKNEDGYHYGPEHWNEDSLIAYFDGHPLYITERNDDQFIKMGDWFSCPKGKLQQAIEDWSEWAKVDFLSDDEWSESEFDHFMKMDMAAIQKYQYRMGQKLVIQITGIIEECVAQVIDFDENSRPVLYVLEPLGSIMKGSRLKDGDYIVMRSHDETKSAS